MRRRLPAFYISQINLEPLKTSCGAGLELSFFIDLSTKIWYLKIMKICKEKLKKLCEKKQITLNQLLREAGVSRNAYYSLLRKNSVLPKSIAAMASKLNVSPSAFLEEESLSLQKARALLARVDKISKHHKVSDPDNIRHTLLLLEEEPVNRLKRALLRAQKFAFH